MKIKPKPIYCKRCGRQVATYDGKASANIEVKCKKCNVLVIFRPINGTVELKELVHPASVFIEVVINAVWKKSFIYGRKSRNKREYC